MKRSLILAAAVVLTSLAGSTASAVELLTGGNFEVAGGSIPDWSLQESLTGLGDPIDSAGVIDFAPIEGTKDLWLKAFAGGRPLLVPEGNFQLDALPAGDVDGDDILEWQRTVNTPEGLAAWRANYGARAGKLANAVLSQTVNVTAGSTYIFKGQSRWETNYSGGVATLSSFGPLGAVASPTTTKLEMTFLNSVGAVIGTPLSLDLKLDGQSNIDFWQEHTMPPALAPVGATQLRVTARADNMVWNDTDDTVGDHQSGFFDDFSLENQSAPGVEILKNPGLEEVPASGLDPWTVTQVDGNINGPGTQMQPSADPALFEVIRLKDFAQRAPGSAGAFGVWLSPFHGSMEFPVDGILSQTVSGVAGGNYSFSAWSKWEGRYSGGVATITESPVAADVGQTPLTQTLMEIAFLDSLGGVISSAILDVKADRLAQSGGPNPNNGQWYQSTLSRTAPNGTASVKVTASMLKGVFSGPGGQSAFWDDLSLNFTPAQLSVPEPATAVGLVWGLAALGHFARGRRRRQS